MHEDSSIQYRRSLALVVRLMIMIAILAFVMVIIASLSVTDPATEDNPDGLLSINVNKLAAGQLRKVTFFDREVWVYHRRPTEILSLGQQGQSLRSSQPQYFVFLPYEPVRQCLVQWDEPQRVFYDPCYAKHYNLAGYPVAGENKQQQLPVVEYRFREGVLILDRQQVFSR